MSLLIFSALVISSNEYLLFEGKHFKEYTDSFYFTFKMYGYCRFCKFCMIIWKMTQKASIEEVASLKTQNICTQFYKLNISGLEIPTSKKVSS